MVVHGHQSRRDDRRSFSPVQSSAVPPGLGIIAIEPGIKMPGYYQVPLRGSAYIRVLVRRILRKYGQATQTVLEQAKLLCAECAVQ